MASYSKTYDVIVVGGGPAGCSMAALLADHGIKVACIDQDDPVKTLHENFDGRTTAISFGSQRVLDAAGAWDILKPHTCPIKNIKISESGSPTLLEFNCEEVDADAFGWIVENRLLRQSLYQRLSSLKHAAHIAPAKVSDYKVTDKGVEVILADGQVLNAALVIGADGRNSFTRGWMGINTRGWTYNQRAIVCVASHENSHENIAVEDFRGEGPFAILPMQDDAKSQHRSAIVWTEHGADRSSALHWDDAVFAAALSERFPDFYGAITPITKRFSYPLGLVHAHSYIGPRMALVADAAHGIHPIAGQGLNLGLRDIAALAELIIRAYEEKRDLGSRDMLESYQAARRLDNITMAAATDTLNKVFSNSFMPLRLTRKAGLRAIQRTGRAKKFFMRYAMGTSGLLPSLVREGKF